MFKAGNNLNQSIFTNRPVMESVVIARGGKWISKVTALARPEVFVFQYVVLNYGAVSVRS